VQFDSDVKKDGLLEYFAKRHEEHFKKVAKEICNLKYLHRMDTIATEAMCHETALTGEQLREIRGFVAAEVGEPVLEYQGRLLDDLVQDSPAI
jgi:hypothetical protein